MDLEKDNTTIGNISDRHEKQTNPHISLSTNK